MTDVTYVTGTFSDDENGTVVWGDTQHGYSDYAVSPIRIEGDTLQWFHLLYAKAD